MNQYNLFFFIIHLLLVNSQTTSDCLFKTCDECLADPNCGTCEVGETGSVACYEASSTICTSSAPSSGLIWNDPASCQRKIDATDCGKKITSCSDCLADPKCGWCDFGTAGLCTLKGYETTCNTSPTATWQNDCKAAEIATKCRSYSTDCNSCFSDSDCGFCQVNLDSGICYPDNEAAATSCSTIYNWKPSTCEKPKNYDLCKPLSCGKCSNATECTFCQVGANVGYCYPNEAKDFCSFAWNPAQCDSTCQEISDMKFCTSLNGLQTDMIWVTSLYDNIFATIFNSTKKNIEKIAKEKGFSFCDDCWDAISQLACATGAPDCGWYDCIVDLLPEFTKCQTETCKEECDSNSNQNLFNQKCWQCVGNCYITKLQNSCGSFMFSKKTCSDVVGICGCITDTSVIDQICAWYPENGRDLNLDKSLTCKNSPGWCSNNGLRKRSEVLAGSVCPNSEICLSIPQLTGANSVAEIAESSGSKKTNSQNDGGNSPSENSSKKLLISCFSLSLLLFFSF